MVCAASQVPPHPIFTLQILYEVHPAHGDVYWDAIQSCVSLSRLAASLLDAEVLILPSFESNRPPVVKQAAVAYLASFTARGARVQSEQVKMITQTFLNYMDHYRAVHSSCRGPDVRRYSQY